MDTIAGFPELIIPDMIEPTLFAFRPRLEAHRSSIESATRKTFKFGDTERHKLDVYYPKVTPGETKKLPVVFFGYGGGFTRGDRVFDAPFDLLYGNYGSFYSRHGIITIIPDYRLVPNVKYPGMAEDLRDAVVWTLHNAQLVAQGSNVELDTDNFFVMGQSAGGTNATTLFLSPGLLPREILPHVKGLILMGVTTHISRKEDCEEAVLQYYGSEEEMKEHEPLTLLTRAPQEIIDSLPRIFMLKSEKEPLFILEGYDMFVKLLKERNHSPAREEVMQGHNHISPALSLGSGEGEEFGEQIAQWIIDTAALN